MCSNVSQILLLYKKWGYCNEFYSAKLLGVCYWCVKIPQCGYMGHGLKLISFYVQKHIAALAMCHNPPLVRDKPLGVPTSVKLVYYLVVFLVFKCPCFQIFVKKMELVRIWDMRCLGLYSLSGKTSYCQISRSLEAARLGVIMIVSLWNLTGISAAVLPRCLSNFKAIESLNPNLATSRLHEILR